jgi:glycosyltransferase involved in cell wall biosynthesis
MSPLPQILHITANLDGYGLNRQLELLAAAQRAAGQNVAVVALAAERLPVATLRQLGVECRVLGRRWPLDPLTVARLVRVLRRSQADLLHVWGESAQSYLRWAGKFSPKKPTLTSLPSQTCLNGKPLGGVPQGVAPASPDPRAREQFLAEQQLSPEAPLIMVAGPLTRQQNIEAAIWYFELVRTLNERARLLIFGDGPDRHRLERFSRLAAEPDSIRFLGYRNDFRQLLPCAHVFWHTAHPSETLPQAVLEAMQAGVPVIARDSPGCRQVLRDSQNGYLVADKSRAVFTRHTQHVLQNPAQAEQLADAAQASVEAQYSLQQMTQSYTDSYTQLFGD